MLQSAKIGTHWDASGDIISPIFLSYRSISFEKSKQICLETDLNHGDGARDVGFWLFFYAAGDITSWDWSWI
jgi:hypothetical protein